MNKMTAGVKPPKIISKKDFRDKISWKKDFKKNGTIYLIFIPILIYFFVFHYIPMIGLVMAFQRFSVVKGIFGSPWIGLENFRDLFSGGTFFNAFRNTVAISLFKLSIGFIAPVILALLISQLKSKRFSRTAQTVTYMPYFVSAVVVTSLAIEFFSADGAITTLLGIFGVERQNLLASTKIPVFWSILTSIEVWQGAGYSAIIYLASIAHVNPELYEAAAMDGAGRWKRLFHITLPGIKPILIMLFTLQVGLVFKTGFDKVLLLYMPSNYEVSDVLYTYTYRMAFGETTNFGLSVASGLFQSIIGTILLIGSNRLAKRRSEQTLF